MPESQSIIDASFLQGIFNPLQIKNYESGSTVKKTDKGKVGSSGSCFDSFGAFVTFSHKLSSQNGRGRARLTSTQRNLSKILNYLNRAFHEMKAFVSEQILYLRTPCFVTE